MTKDEQIVWDLVYAQIIGIQFHPGNKHRTTRTEWQYIIQLAAEVAEEAIRKRRTKCHSG